MDHRGDEERDGNSKSMSRISDQHFKRFMEVDWMLRLLSTFLSVRPVDIPSFCFVTPTFCLTWVEPTAS